MERKQTSTTIRHTENGNIATKTTRITQESRLDRSRRIASQNSTLFRFALSGTIVVLFFGLFLLIGTTDYYNSNAQDLKWVDENGQFIENSYNLAITFTNDTPLNDLNGLTLNDIFLDSQLLLNPNFENGDSNWLFNVGSYSINEGIVTFTTTAQNQAIYTIENFNVGHTYYNVARAKTLTLSIALRNYGLIGSPYKYVPATNQFEIVSIKAVAEDLNSSLQMRQLTSSNLGEKYLDFVYLYDLTNLGLENMNINDLDFYFNFWYNNNFKRNLNSYNNLGNIPVTNLENMNAVLFKPAVDIVNGMTDTATGALGFSLQAWNFVIDIWNRIWGG